MDLSIPMYVRDVLNKLEANGYEAYIVGGCVRDSILGINPKDYDIATNALPGQTVECFKDEYKVIETGLQHGTVTVISENHNLEITTYRIDGEYSDHRRPEVVSFTSSIDADLARRDFTINAMAYSDKTGIIDKFGGQKDLFNRRIKCVGVPEERFEEDALRIMRAIRFASVLDFRIEISTAAAMHAKKGLLKEISAERINSELVKFATGVAPCSVMLEFDDIFTTIIPEFSKCIGFDQHSRYHIYDVWEHTAHALENSKDDKEIRLAILFHDIDKPLCFKLDDEGQGHFPNHEKRSADTAESIMKRLHFDKETIKNTVSLIKYHYITPVDDKRVVKHLISTLGLPMFLKLTEVMKGDSRSKQSFCLERVNILDAMKYLAYDIVNRGECCTLHELAVKGSDLENIGFEGRAVGAALDELLNMVIDEKLPNDKEILIEKAREFGSSDTDSYRGSLRVIKQP